jgi:hypothetical protein
MTPDPAMDLQRNLADAFSWIKCIGRNSGTGSESSSSSFLI